MRLLKVLVRVGLAGLVAILAWISAWQWLVVGRLEVAADDVWIVANFKDRPHNAGEADQASIAGYGEIRIYRDARLA